MSKRYFGVPVPDASGAGLTVRVADSDLPQAPTRRLDPRLDLARLAPGLSWGAQHVATRERPNPGAAQLALAILADCLGDAARARALFRRYAHRVTNGFLVHEAWSLGEDQVRQVVAEIEEVAADPQMVKEVRAAARERAPVADERGGGTGPGVGSIERGERDSGDARFNKR